MFNSIRGIVTEKIGDTLRIVNSGIEWELSCPANDLDALPPAGEEARVFAWLYVREDALKLYGFADEGRRSTFLELLKVEGVGPKGALKILGNISQIELEAALENEDVGRLEAVPGLGKKTAQKMILALRGKLASAKTRAADSSAPYAELAAALAEMGYDRRQAADALARADAETDASLKGAEREQALFKRAIVSLAGA